MTVNVRLADTFGEFCADGERAAKFRFERIDPYVAECDQINLDFANIRNMNSSFCNALIANLISQNSEAIIPKLRFQNCRENIQVLVVAAIELGVQRLRERHDQQLMTIPG